MFGNDGPQVQLPSLGHLIAPSSYPEATIPVGIANLWMEVTAVWRLVLLASGIYLWWPRAIESAKPLLVVLAVEAVLARRRPHAADDTAEAPVGADDR